MTEEDKNELSFELYEMSYEYNSEDHQISAMKRCIEIIAKELGVEPWDPSPGKAEVK